jgi:hypothetical protein
MVSKVFDKAHLYKLQAALLKMQPLLGHLEKSAKALALSLVQTV